MPTLHLNKFSFSTKLHSLLTGLAICGCSVAILATIVMRFSPWISAVDSLKVPQNPNFTKQ